MVPVVPKDKLSGHKLLGDRRRIGEYHLQLRILGFSIRPVVRQTLCLESSEEALLYFDHRNRGAVNYALLLQWIGAGLKSLHRREVLRLYSESRRVVARLYHPDDHDCLVLTGPMT